MVGLKHFWLLICTLLFLAACVPQTKQTECGANEAFNASLRSCVPIVGGPTSFINIASYSPQFTQTRYKDDATILAFTITVSNPYNQAYTVEWERVFNAGPVTICSGALTCNMTASLLGTTLGQVGTHIITAKIKDTAGNIVDSHNFELKVNDLPRPIINNATINPASYAFEAYPTDANIAFNFTIKNNNATISALDGYKTTWTVVKDGVTVLTEIDAFTSFSLTGTNTTYLGTSVAPSFDPNGGVFGVGSYIIRAVVSNDTPGEVVDEHQWNVVVKEADLANVTNISLPAPGTTITAHHDVDYDDYPTESWIYGAGATQPQFCVDIDDRDGTYPGDGKVIHVKYYLDGLGGDICTKTTLDTPGTQTVCLVDATTCLGSGAVFDESILKFSNSGTTVTQTHKVTARLFDEATTYEFDRADVIPSSGSYPIEWILSVKPQNTAPKLTFATRVASPTCTSTGAFSRSCAVDQGTSYDFAFKVTDDFYDPATEPEEFEWDIKLKRNGSDITSTGSVTECSKLLTVAVPTPGMPNTTTYGTEWYCKIDIPHFDPNGPLNPASGAYSIVLNMQDSGSPVGGTSEASQSLTWNLVITEKNPSGISIAPQTALLADSHVANGVVVLDPASPLSFATETDTVTFRMNVTDAELDNFKYRVSLCTVNTPTPCTSSVPQMVYTDYLRVSQLIPDLNPTLVSALLYQLPEDLLLQVSPQLDADLVTPEIVYFKVEAVDSPSSVLVPTVTDSEIFSFHVLNYNPAPSINTATASPAIGTTTVVYSGLPFTIDPGSASDASTATTENAILYQWYADRGAGFVAITGATSRILKYTPGNSTVDITLKVCVGDRPAANPVSSAGNCFGNWTVTPEKYLQNLTAWGIGATESVDGESAVWFDEFNNVASTQVIYSAFVETNADSTKDVFIEKTIKNAAGDMVYSTRAISFAGLAGATNTDTIQNLSITGDENNIYVAYLASAASAPATMIPRIRRIEKYKLAAGSKAALDHSQPFGFGYTHYGLSEVAANATVADGDGTGGAATITFTGALALGDTITINGITFTATAAPASGALEICASPDCSTGTEMATNVAAKINNSTNQALRGITASSAAGIVSLHGRYASDYLDFDGSIAGVPGLVSASNGLGKIFISGTRWYLPFINSSLGGSQQNNITVLSGVASTGSGVGFHLRNAGLALSTNNDLLDMGRVALFDAKVNQAGELVIAAISGEVADAGSLKLYRYELSAPNWSLFDTTGGSATDQNELQLFGSSAFEYVKLAADQVSNSSYYVIAKENILSGGDYYIGRYNTDLDSAATPAEYLLSAKVDTAADDWMTNSLLMFPDLVSVPGQSEARIIFQSVGAGATPYPFMARWKSDDTITCGTVCTPLNGSIPYLSTAGIGISQVANNLDFGAAGSVAAENTKDFVFILMSSNTSGVLYRPQLGNINIEAEAIQSTTEDATGLFRPPFVN